MGLDTPHAPSRAGWRGEVGGRVLGRAGVHHRSLWKLGKLTCREGTQRGQAAQPIMGRGSLVHAPQ